MISNWNGFRVILVKEIVDNLRDRRTLTTMAVSIIVGPLILFGFLWFAEKTVKQETDLVNADPIPLAVVGAELAPNLIIWLEQNNIEIVAPPNNPEQAVNDGEHRVVLIIEASFVDAFNTGRSAPLRLIHDSSLGGFKKLGFNTISRAIRLYDSQIGSLRLQARGISPEVVRPIILNVSDVASAQARNAEILNMMPYLIIIFIMAGGMYLAIDTTAGEREHGSLESLLAQPTDRRYILLAKLGATIIFSALTFLLVLIGLALSFEFVPIEAITIRISATKITKIFLTCLPFVFVACALMVLLASFTKSYKEAQSYMGMVMLVPSMPLILLGFLAPAPSLSNMWVPSLSQGLIIIETLKGEGIAWSLIGMSMLSSLVVAGILSYIAIKLYQREGILG
ncbi:MAG: sodium transport system permease protein [Arenicella sp.]|jgi:sodium transport system permease protein